MKLKYVGPHDGVEIEDVESGYRGTAERDGEVIPEPQGEVAKRLLEQESNYKKLAGTPAEKE